MTIAFSSERLEEGVLSAQLHWQARHEAEATSTADDGPTFAPAAFTIAISREAGANGSAVADRLGKRLGWPVYDRELLRHIAEEMGLNARLLQSVDEKRANWLMTSLQAFASANAVSPDAYLYNLSKVVLSLAAHGECIMVGRGVAQFLPAEKTLRVRLVAPLAERIAVIQERTGLARDEAARQVARIDQDRTHFVHTYFHKDPADPTLYDLILNTARLSVEDCTDLIEQVLRRFQARTSAALRTPARSV